MMTPHSATALNHGAAAATAALNNGGSLSYSLAATANNTTNPALILPPHSPQFQPYLFPPHPLASHPLPPHLLSNQPGAILTPLSFGIPAGAALAAAPRHSHQQMALQGMPITSATLSSIQQQQQQQQQQMQHPRMRNRSQSRERIHVLDRRHSIDASSGLKGY